MDWRDNDHHNQTTQLELVAVYKPTKVVAAVCCFICTLLLIVSICPTDWVETRGDVDKNLIQREGLFSVCQLKAGNDAANCVYQSRDFVKAVAALIIISWMLTLVAGGLITAGMLFEVHEWKQIAYRVALVLSVFSGVLLFISLVVFPVMVSKKLDETLYEVTWMLGWAYMMDWAALIIIIVAAVLLIVDRHPDETSFREKIVNS